MKLIKQYFFSAEPDPIRIPSNIKILNTPVCFLRMSTKNASAQRTPANNFTEKYLLIQRNCKEICSTKISSSKTSPRILSNNNSIKPNFIYKSNEQSTTVSLRTNDKKTSDNKPKDINKEKRIIGYRNPFDYSHMLNARRLIGEQFLKKKEKQIEDKSNSWMCFICAQEYREKRELINHYGMHKRMSDEVEDDGTNKDQEDHIICPVCEHSLTNVYSYKSHIEKHRPKEYTCGICDKNCKSDYTLSVHLAQHNTDTKTLVCNVCKKFSTLSTTNLATHINKNHVKKTFSCDECGDNFTSETWFNGHKIFHYKGGSLSCDKCEMYFSSQRQMINHMKKKHNIKVDLKITKFKCFKCDLTFPKESNLKAHNRDIHAKPNDFLCNVCGMGFPYQYSLTQHLKIHGEGKYVCSTCGKIFKQRRTLTLHVRIHTGEKPNKCKICDKSFSQKSTLNVHIRTHTGERPYPCARCSKGFITKTIRDTHQKKCNKR